jgi:RNA polymerase sigma factor (TIGR02999 family)
MIEVTQILHAIAQGDRQAAGQLLPLVYDELRKLAAHRLAHQTPGQTLQPTALVHEAYLRLVGDREGEHWDNRNHFFAACAEAMRHILTDNARRQQTVKHGGERRRVPLVGNKGTHLIFLTGELGGGSWEPLPITARQARGAAAISTRPRFRPSGRSDPFGPQ